MYPQGGGSLELHGRSSVMVDLWENIMFAEECGWQRKQDQWFGKVSHDTQIQ